MKKQERDLYRLVLDVAQLGLCNACRFATFYGSCEDADLDCRHKLNKRFELTEPGEVWAGSDCFLFRPHLGDSISDCADLAGWWLRISEERRKQRELKRKMADYYTP